MRSLIIRDERDDRESCWSSRTSLHTRYEADQSATVDIDDTMMCGAPHTILVQRHDNTELQENWLQAMGGGDKSEASLRSAGPRFMLSAEQGRIIPQVHHREGNCR